MYRYIYIYTYVYSYMYMYRNVYINMYVFGFWGPHSLTIRYLDPLETNKDFKLKHCRRQGPQNQVQIHPDPGRELMGLF